MPRDSYQTIRRETQRLIDGWEGREVDFKTKPSAVEAEDFVGFANASGGTILVGVAEANDGGGQRGEVVGCEVNDRTRNALVCRAESCNPPVSIQITAENMSTTTKQIFRIDVEEGNRKPYGTQGGTYKIRVEGQNAGMPPDLLLAVFLEREQETFLSRFREAVQGLIVELLMMEENIETYLGLVQEAADEAADAARSAAAHAEEAASAAYEAAGAAEDRR